MALRLTAEVSQPPKKINVAAPEYKIKAAFLYNFVKMTRWPSNAFAGPEEPFVIGVLGADPFEGELEKAMAVRSISGRTIKIKRYASAGEVNSQVLFISGSKTGQLPAIFNELEGRPVLTVGDAPGFATRGGMIGLVNRGPEIHFQVNLAVARRAQLKLGSGLLRLAELVPGSNRAEEE